jgi:hypothetical protein
MKVFLGVLILLLSGFGIGMLTRPSLDSMVDYREAERLQDTIAQAGKEEPQLASEAMKHVEKSVLQAPNGDQIIIVNKTFQLRKSADRNYPFIEKVGTH